jgi:hypothetical protein
MNEVEVGFSAPSGTIMSADAFESQIGCVVPVQDDNVTYTEAILVSAEVSECGTLAVLTFQIPELPKLVSEEVQFIPGM